VLPDQVDGIAGAGVAASIGPGLDLGAALPHRLLRSEDDVGRQLAENPWQGRRSAVSAHQSA
jgi:hypothetical protein